MKTILTLLLLMLLAPGALAAPIQVFPGFGGFGGDIAHPAADTMYCVTLPAQFSMTATKLAGRVTTGAVSSTTGFAIYPNTDGGTQLGEAFGASASAGNITATSLSIAITAGTKYRLCSCSTSTSVKVLQLWGPTTGAGRLLSMLNNGTFATAAGSAANACVTGNPPATTGALTALTTFNIPAILLEE